MVKPASEGGVRFWAFTVCSRPAFETAVMACIMANLLSMALVHYPEQAWSTSLQDVLEVAFALLFAVEAGLKLAGFGARFHFAGPERRWNRFDFLLVLASGVDLLLKYGVEGTDPAVSMVLAFMRIFRVGRALRLVKRAKSLNQLFVTLIYSIPSIVNIVLMLCLFLFIFAVLAMDLFGLGPRDGTFITEQTNFATFGRSILTMFRIITGDEWVVVMTEASTRRDVINGGVCEEHDKHHARFEDDHLGCGSDLALVFFPLCYVMMNFFFLNLFISVILENFYEASEGEAAGVTEDDVLHFKNVWAMFDPGATQLMSLKGIPSLLRHIGPPLSVCQAAARDDGGGGGGGGGGFVPPTQARVFALMAELEITIDDPKGRVHFKNLLFTLMKRVLGTEMPTEDIQVVREIEEEAARNLERAKLKRGSKYAVAPADELGPLRRDTATRHLLEGECALDQPLRKAVADTLLRHYFASVMQRRYRFLFKEDPWAVFHARCAERARQRKINNNLAKNSKLMKLTSLDGRSSSPGGSTSKQTKRRWKTMFTT